MRRSSTWEADLGDYLSSVRGKPFEWGSHDCCTFISGAIEAMTGIDPMVEFRGEYDSALSSAKALKRIGAGSLTETLDTKFREIPVGRAQRGDIVLFDDSVGVVAGAWAWFVSDEDLERVPVEYWERAWSIGRG